MATRTDHPVQQGNPQCSAGYQPAGLGPIWRGLGTPDALPIGNRRYGRLQICATHGRRSNSGSEAERPARPKPPASQQRARQSRLFLDCSSIGSLLVLYWSSIGPLLVLYWSSTVFRITGVLFGCSCVSRTAPRLWLCLCLTAPQRRRCERIRRVRRPGGYAAGTGFRREVRRPKVEGRNPKTESRKRVDDGWLRLWYPRPAQ